MLYKYHEIYIIKDNIILLLIQSMAIMISYKNQNFQLYWRNSINYDFYNY